MKHSSYFGDDDASTTGIVAVGRAPGVGDVFPDLWADSTHGEMQLHAWAQGQFTIFFSHPSAYAAASERDVVMLAHEQHAFDIRGCRILGLTQSDPMTERMWIEELSERHGVDIVFPIISDEDGRIARACGMGDLEAGTISTTAKTYILLPDLTVGAALEYPVSVPRSAPELLRLIDVFRSSLTA